MLDPSTGKTNHDQVKITNITQVDHDKSTSDAVVFVTSTCVNVDTGDPADCLPKSDPRMISVTQLNFVADRTTALAFDDPKTPRDPGARLGPGQQVAVPRREEELRRLGRRHARPSPPADYVGETTMDGLKVYQYHQVITGAPIDLGNDIQGIYNLDETYSIDPVTGKIIDQQVHDVRTLKDGGDTALDLTAEYTPETIKSNVDDAKAGAKQLTLITKVLPIVGLVVGLICVALGVFLLRRSRRSPPRPPRRRRATGHAVRLAAAGGLAQPRSAAKIAVPGVSRPRVRDQPPQTRSWPSGHSGSSSADDPEPAPASSATQSPSVRWCST